MEWFYKVLTIGKRFLVEKYYARKFFQGISSQSNGLATNRQKHVFFLIDRAFIRKIEKGRSRSRGSIRGSIKGAG